MGATERPTRTWRGSPRKPSPSSRATSLLSSEIRVHVTWDPGCGATSLVVHHPWCRDAQPGGGARSASGSHDRARTIARSGASDVEAERVMGGSCESSECT